MKKVQVYSVAIPLFATLELLMPSAAFTEAVMIFAILLMAEIICVEDLPLSEEERVKLKESYDSAISSNDKVSAMKAYRKLNSCGLKEAKIHVDSVLAENASS
jgi:ribosomal protein L7/L12